MDRQKIKTGIDSAAEQARETVDLLADKLDQATYCAEIKTEKIKTKMKEGLIKAADRAEEIVATTADHIREKARQ